MLSHFAARPPFSIHRKLCSVSVHGLERSKTSQGQFQMIREEREREAYVSIRIYEQEKEEERFRFIPITWCFVLELDIVLVYAVAYAFPASCWSWTWRLCRRSTSESSNRFSELWFVFPAHVLKIFLGLSPLATALLVLPFTFSSFSFRPTPWFFARSVRECTYLTVAVRLRLCRPHHAPAIAPK